MIKNDSAKKFRWGHFLISLVVFLAGVCLLIFPNVSLTAGSYIIASSAILTGIITFIKLLANRSRGATFASGIISCVLTLVCGIVGLFIPDKIMEYYPMFIGLILVIDGTFKLQSVINAKRYEIKFWWGLLIASVITIAGGFLCIRLRLGEGETDVFIFSLILGIAVIFCSIQNFISLFMLDKIIDRAKRKVESYAKDITDDYIAADSYINTDKKRLETEILEPENIEQNTLGDKKKKSKQKKAEKASQDQDIFFEEQESKQLNEPKKEESEPKTKEAEPIEFFDATQDYEAYEPNNNNDSFYKPENEENDSKNEPIEGEFKEVEDK